MGSSVTITGERELLRELNRLKGKVALEAVRKGTREGSKVFKAETKSNITSMLSGKSLATFKSGKVNISKTNKAIKDKTPRGNFKNIANDMLRALVVSPKKKQRENEYLMKTWFHPRSSVYLVYRAKEDGNRSYIPAAIEYGHEKVLWGKRTGGRVAPIPFMRKAFDTKNGEAAIKTMKTMKKVIEAL